MGLLNEKVILITGGGSGIGRAAALAAAREGAWVMVSDINEESADETVALIHEIDGEAKSSFADVSSEEDVSALVAETVAVYTRLDCAFNNAGVGGTLARFEEKREDEWEQVIGVNLKGVWLCMKYELKAMLGFGGGSIVNMASVAGLVGFSRGGIYSASKHGVIGLTRSAALEYARKNIRVNAVCPAFTDTPMVRDMFEVAPNMIDSSTQNNPMHRLGTPDEIAQAVVWLCSEKASFINGQALALDGGLTAG